VASIGSTVSAVRDEQVRRYARHILLPDVGGLGQTALMVATAKIELRESEPLAELIAAQYLAAGGVGTLVLSGATAAQRASVAARAGDTRLVTEGNGRDVGLQPRPSWWPSAIHGDGDATALAFWRGGLAALRWMADVVNR
jgi:hypothetical protein